MPGNRQKIQNRLKIIIRALLRYSDYQYKTCVRSKTIRGFVDNQINTSHSKREALIFHPNRGLYERIRK